MFCCRDAGPVSSSSSPTTVLRKRAKIKQQEINSLCVCVTERLRGGLVQLGIFLTERHFVITASSSISPVADLRGWVYFWGWSKRVEANQLSKFGFMTFENDSNCQTFEPMRRYTSSWTQCSRSSWHTQPLPQGTCFIHGERRSKIKKATKKSTSSVTVSKQTSKKIESRATKKKPKLRL